MQLQYYYKALGYVLEKNKGRGILGRVGSILAGFIKGRSHQGKPTSLFGKIADLPDKGNTGDLICLDISEALYQVPHGKHLVKQEEMGLRVRVVRNG